MHVKMIVYPTDMSMSIDDEVLMAGFKQKTIYIKTCCQDMREFINIGLITVNMQDPNICTVNMLSGNTTLLKGAKHCPYCGTKIKVESIKFEYISKERQLHVL